MYHGEYFFILSYPSFFIGKKHFHMQIFNHFKKILGKFKLNYTLLLLIFIIIIQIILNIYFIKKINSLAESSSKALATEEYVKRLESKLDAMYSQLYRLRNYQFQYMREK